MVMVMEGSSLLGNLTQILMVQADLVNQEVEILLDPFSLLERLSRERRRKQGERGMGEARNRLVKSLVL